MTFEPIYNTDARTFVTIMEFVVVALMCTSALFFVYAIFEDGKKQMTRFKRGVFFGVLGLFIIVSLFVIRHQTLYPEAVENNLKQKYDISSVIDDNPMYEINPQKSEEQPIQVEAPDGRKAVFILTQEMDTFEPTLSELVDNGTAGSVTLEEITK